MAIAKKRKRFFDVEMPLINKTTQLMDYELENLNGRYIQYDLTRILKGKSIMLQLKVKSDGEKAISYATQIKLMPYYIRRMMRKGTDYVEDSFSANCKDSELTIKPFLITRRRVSKPVLKALRSKTKEEIINYIKNKSAEELFDDVLKNKLQKELSIKLKKIYPLSLCEIKELKVEKNIEISEQQETKSKSSKKKESSEE